jgi:electron transfer flavoprotein alpha/beta subunit
MNILVCFKAVPDLNMLTVGDWVVKQNLQLDVSFVRLILNSYDESALEIALRLSDASARLNLSLTLSTLTIDGPKATSILKYLNALRFNQVIRIDHHEDTRFNSTAIASILTQYVSKYAPQDILLTGRQNGVGENAQTPLLTAEMLGWPCITQVIGVEPVDKQHVTVTCLADDGRLQQTIQTPCVLSVGDAPSTFLRVPTISDRMRYGKRPIKVLSSEDFETCDETNELIDLKIVEYKRPAILIEGQSPQEKANKLYHAHLKERMAKP